MQDQPFLPLQKDLFSLGIFTSKASSANSPSIVSLQQVHNYEQERDRNDKPVYKREHFPPTKVMLSDEPASIFLSSYLAQGVSTIRADMPSTAPKTQEDLSQRLADFHSALRTGTLCGDSSNPSVTLASTLPILSQNIYVSLEYKLNKFHTHFFKL